jgi:hypothetical protein
LNLITDTNLIDKDASERVIDFVKETKDGLAKIIKNGDGQIVIPDAMKIEKQNLIDYDVSLSFASFIDKIDTICEVAILGQAGTTRQLAASRCWQLGSR